jgi:SAM-dependent methyltransferase
MGSDANSGTTEPEVLFARVARRYRGYGRFARHYVAAKLRCDPVHRDLLALAARERFGDVVDIGCGRGQLSTLLLEARLARSVVGLDYNAAHLQQARGAAIGLAFSAILQDLAECQEIPKAATVLLIDVLYQLEPRVQMVLLRAAIRAARERLIIRTLDPNRGVRSRLTLCFEKLMRGLSPHSGEHIAARQVSCIEQVLDEAGLVTCVVPCWQGTPFANVLIVGRPPK